MNADAMGRTGSAVARLDLWRRLTATLATWRRRTRERRELVRMSELELHDFGVSRSQALAEADKPFWID